MRRLLRWWRDPDGRRDEKSNSFVLFIITLPVIIGSFGIGVDIARNVYVSNVMQDNLDLAVYGALGDSHTNGPGNLVLDDRAHVLADLERVYDMNRSDSPGLSCTGTGTVAGTAKPKCWTTSRTPVITDKTICYWATEKSRNAFLPVLSKNLLYQTYHLSSGGTISRDRLATCN